MVPGDASPLGRRLAAAAPPDARARANMEVGLLSGGAVQDFWVPCEAGRCFIAVAVSDEEDREVDLALSDDRGRRVDFIDPDGSVAVLRHCSEGTRTLRVRVHLEEGMGRFALQIFDEAPSRGPGEVAQ